MKRKIISMIILTAMVASNVPVVNANASTDYTSTENINVENNEQISEDEISEEEIENNGEEVIENHSYIVEEEQKVKEEEEERVDEFSNDSEAESEHNINEVENIVVLEENAVEVSPENSEVMAKSNDEITDDTIILENPQLVEELEGQTWFLEMVAAIKNIDISEVTINDIKNIEKIKYDSEKIPEGSSIPKLIGRFEELTYIKVSGSYAAYRYDILESLETDGNLSRISKDISKCKKLNDVDFSFNNITEVPDELFNMKNIISLDFSCTALKRIDGVLDKICNLENLEDLDLSATGLNLNDIKNLKELRNLKKLDISSNGLNCDIKDICENINVMDKLDINGNIIYGNGKYLLKYNEEVNVDCSDNFIYFSDEDIKSFEKYSNGYRTVCYNFYNTDAVESSTNKEVLSIYSTINDRKIEKGTSIDEIKESYLTSLRMTYFNGVYSGMITNIFKERVPYTLDIKNQELFDENGIAIKDGVATIEIKYDDESILWQDQFEIVANITNLNIKYVDEEGNEILAEDNVEGDYGDIYTINPKDIEGYKFESINGDNLEDTYNYKFGNENGEVTLVYSKVNEFPVITGKDYIEIEVGDEFDPIKDLEITANDDEDGDISDSVEIVESDVDTTKAGEYKVVISVKDSAEQVSYFTATVKVKEKEVIDPVEPSEPEDPVKPAEPVQPENPKQPEQSENPVEEKKPSNISNTNKQTTTKSELPKTGGVGSSLSVIIASLLIAAGKKKLK